MGITIIARGRGMKWTRFKFNEQYRLHANKGTRWQLARHAGASSMEVDVVDCIVNHESTMNAWFIAVIIVLEAGKSQTKNLTKQISFLPCGQQTPQQL